MRTINYLVAHCTGTSPMATVEGIKRYWSRFLGWKNPGYHYLIDQDGNVHELLQESMVANGVKGHNHESIHVGYIGGLSKKEEFVDTRTYSQKREMFILFQMLKTRYPNAKIQGHRDFAGVNKACPCFDAKKEFNFF